MYSTKTYKIIKITHYCLILDLGMCCNNETDTANETKTATIMYGLSAMHRATIYIPPHKWDNTNINVNQILN